MADKNMCLAANGGTLSGDATEGTRDNDFTTSVNYLDEHGGAASVVLQLLIAGVWTTIASASGSGDPGWGPGLSGAVTVNGPWEKVTGIKGVNAAQSTKTSVVSFPSCTISYAKWGYYLAGNSDIARCDVTELQAWGFRLSASYGQII